MLVDGIACEHPAEPCTLFIMMGCLIEMSADLRLTREIEGQLEKRKYFSSCLHWYISKNHQGLCLVHQGC